jgi:HEAT repeat protein
VKSHFVILIILVSSMVANAGEQPTLQESITTALITATNDVDDNVRFAAYSALKELPKSDAVVEAFRRGLKDDNTDVRVLALSRLVDHEGPTDEVLSRLMRALDEEELSGTAVKLLIQLGEPAVPRLIDAIENEKPSVKVIAADILGKIRLVKHRDKAVASVTSLLKDKDPQIRIAAIGTLKRIATAEFGTVDERALRIARQFVDRIDSNHDGVLTKEEWETSSLQGRLPDADKDQDGRVTAEEVARSLRLLRRPARRD